MKIPIAQHIAEFTGPKTRFLHKKFLKNIKRKAKPVASTRRFLKKK